jgi:hypothetical protein
MLTINLRAYNNLTPVVQTKWSNYPCAWCKFILGRGGLRSLILNYGTGWNYQPFHSLKNNRGYPLNRWLAGPQSSCELLKK